MRKLVAAMALTVLACGGGDSEARVEALAMMGADPTAVRTPAVHEVRMVLNDAGEYRYVPDELTIKIGDTVRWINVSGGPHNVQFKADRIPDGAAEVLNNAMANQLFPLSGALMMAPNAIYEISFEGAPTGEYFYVCTPHELLNMVATLTVED